MSPLARRKREPEAFDGTDVVVEVEEQELPDAPPAHLPQVNLLPSTYARRAALSRAKLFAVSSVGLAVLVAAMAWLVSWQQATSAQERLDAATDRRTVLTREVSKYADVPIVFGRVESAARQLEVAMGNEVRWSFFLNDLALSIPSGVSLDSLQVGSIEPGAAPTDGGIGTMSVDAKALTYNTVANWLDSLAKLPTLTDPYVGTMSATTLEGQPIVAYSSTATITTRAMSQRYSAQEVTP